MKGKAPKGLGLRIYDSVYFHATIKVANLALSVLGFERVITKGITQSLARPFICHLPKVWVCLGILPQFEGISRAFKAV
jgi:hypothetical protein